MSAEHPTDTLRITDSRTGRSAVTFIDGDRGILRDRGYPIQELCTSARANVTTSRPRIVDDPRSAFDAEPHSPLYGRRERRVVDGDELGKQGVNAGRDLESL